MNAFIVACCSIHLETYRIASKIHETPVKSVKTKKKKNENTHIIR